MNNRENLWSIVLIELTNCCNFSCRFCPSDFQKRKRVFMSSELWEKVIREIGEKKMARTVFFHLLGEPLLHKDLFDAIRLANSYGLNVSLYTNGALLDQNNREQLFRSFKKGRIVLSLQEILPDDFNARCRGHLNWDAYIYQLQTFMQQAQKKGLSVQIHCMVDVQPLGWNFLKVMTAQKIIQDFYNNWAKSMGQLKSQKINILNPAKSYSLGDNCSFFVKHHGWWSNGYIPNYAKVIPQNQGHCVLMNDTFAVLADGTCTFCCSDYEGGLNLGNAHEKTLEEIFYGKKSEEIRRAEQSGKMTQDTCKICRGQLIDRRTGKSMLKRNWFSEFYFFQDHWKRYGFKSTFKKIKENLKRRLVKKN